MAENRPVIIAGGGIGGLALALALSQAGRRAVVLERRAQFETEGAGIQLGPNGVRVLRRLGIADALRGNAGEPECIAVHDGRSGRAPAHRRSAWLAARHGAPYWAAHRGDLHAALLAAVAGDARVELRTGCEVVSATQADDGVQATCASGDGGGSVLVGADGLWSSVRRAIRPRRSRCRRHDGDAGGHCRRPLPDRWRRPSSPVADARRTSCTTRSGKAATLPSS